LSTELGFTNLHDLSGARTYGNAGAGSKLSARQIELLQLMADGKHLADTAKVMGVSRNMSRNRAIAIRRKLDAETTTHAVAIALRLGLIT